MVNVKTRFYWEKIRVIGCQYVKKQTQDFRYYLNRIFLADLISEWSKYMTKILLFRFKQSFWPFNKLTAHKCSDKRLFRHLKNPAFCSLSFEKQINSESHVFFQSISLLCRFEKLWKKLRKYFGFWDNSIWIGCVKHSLLLRQNTCHRVSIC